MRFSITSSELIARAVGIQPTGTPAESAGVCALCGAEIKEGDLASPLALGPSFMDDLYMACRGSKVVCGWCGPHLTKQGIVATGFGVFSLAEGSRPFRKWGDIAKAITDPPPPPFVMVYSNAQQQHMAWRAPVNWSRDQFYVRVGLRDLKIRHRFLEDAAQACILLGKAITEARLKRTKSKKLSKVAKKTLPNPFVYMSSDLKDISHARVVPMAFEVAQKSPVLQEALDKVQRLTLGESWALRFILTPGAGKKTDTKNEETTD